VARLSSLAAIFMNAGGSFCFTLRTGANRSPDFSIRATASRGVKNSESMSFLRCARSSSSQVTGIDTNGSSRFARSE
jgi:hypothetical protein